MGALERKVCPFVVERQFRDRCDILCSAFVLCVAVFAFMLLFESPVRPQPLLDVRTDVFMTVLAEGIHRCLVEPFVALRTVFFPFGMTLDHLSRHQGGLDIVCPDRWAHKHQHAEESHDQIVG